MFKNTLLIDDDPNTLFLHRHFLGHFDFFENLIEFQDANKALTFLSSEYFNDEILIFLDLNMPLMTGWEFIDKLPKVLNASQLSKLIIVIVSSSSNLKYISIAHDHPHVYTYMEKPFLVGDIENLIKNLQREKSYKQVTETAN